MLVQIAPSIVALVRQSHLTANDQTAIEAEINRIAAERNCTSQRAAQLIHLAAYSDVH